MQRYNIWAFIIHQPAVLHNELCITIQLGIRIIMKVDAASLSICDQLTVADLYCAFPSASYSNTLIAVRYYLTIIYDQLTAIGIILIYMNGIARYHIVKDIGVI